MHKLNEEIDYPIPFFASLFPDVFDINDYKLLKKARTEMEKLCYSKVAKIPYMKNADKANAFALHMDDALGFGNKAISSPTRIKSDLSYPRMMTLMQFI